MRWIPVGGYKNLAQGHRQLGGRVVAKFIKDLVARYGKQPSIDACNNLCFVFIMFLEEIIL